MMELNKNYEIEITGISSDGNGTGHIDGMAVFVPYTAVGDYAEVKITKIMKRYSLGTLMRIINPSPDRIIPECGVYGKCGGCSLGHIDYVSQLEAKRLIIENAMQRIGGFTDFKLDKMNGMENPYNYRNKMIFHAGKLNGKPVFGFYESKTHSVIPAEICMTGNKANYNILEAVKEYMEENSVSVFDEKIGKGLIRSVFIRTADKTGEIMAVISINGKDIPNHEALIKKLCNANSYISSIIININTDKKNNNLGTHNFTIYGRDTISDILMGIKFDISPHSFFQINPIMTQKLYSAAIEYAQISRDTNLMDIYCGIGTISLCAAKSAKCVTGIEIVEQAIADAKKNAEANGILNAVFYADKAENIVPMLIKNGECPDVVILDPPRKGSDEKTLTAIAAVRPERIVYVSCNPATLARDTKFLAENGYALNCGQGFDMFPHTNHVETVVLMSKHG